jgi:hypothetical protein
MDPVVLPHPVSVMVVQSVVDQLPCPETHDVLPEERSDSQMKDE